MKKDYRVLLYFIGGIYLFGTIVRLVLFPHQTIGWHIEAGLFGFVALLMVATVIKGIESIFDKYYPYERNIFIRLTLQFLVSLAILMTIRQFFFEVANRYLTLSISKDWIIAATIIHIVSIAALIFSMFGFHFFNKWQETELKKEKLEKEKATVQYDNLKNQLNPHFLFNSLTSLNALIFENPTLASEFLQQLSKVYRYVLENKDKTLVTLATEVKFVANYVHLLKARFDEGLEVNIEIDDMVSDKQILPVTLQILIENAIKHNSTSKNTPLRINIYAQDGYLVVKNNLQIKKVVENSNKQGLENLKNLYTYLIEKEIQIKQDSSSFAVMIPLIDS